VNQPTLKSRFVRGVSINNAKQISEAAIYPY